MNHIARSKVLAEILIQRLVEFSDQLLEDHSHCRVVNLVRVQINVLEAFEHLKKKTPFVEFADRVVEIELLQYLAHVGTEFGDIVPQVGCEVWRVREELIEIVAGRVVEGETRHFSKLGIEVL